jgi:hypothetical protein
LAAHGRASPGPRHHRLDWSRLPRLRGRQANSNYNQTHRYRVADDAWAPLATGPSQRFGSLGAWDGSYLIAWGGRKETGGAPVTYDDGKRFDGTAWTNLSTTGLPSARDALHRRAGFTTRIARRH